MVESLPEILTKRRIQAFFKPVDLHFVTNAIGETTSSVSFWNIVNQLGQYDFSCGSVVNNLTDRQLFSDQINRNCLDLILSRRYCNCSTVENLRCVNCAVNETRQLISCKSLKLNLWTIKRLILYFRVPFY